MCFIGPELRPEIEGQYIPILEDNTERVLIDALNRRMNT